LGITLEIFSDISAREVCCSDSLAIILLIVKNNQPPTLVSKTTASLTAIVELSLLY
jgi:hypothetical protein